MSIIGQKTEDITNDLVGVVCQPSQMAISIGLDAASSRLGPILSSSIRRQTHCRGFSLFELVVVIGIIAVLMSIFLSRVLYYQEQAEKTAMEGVAGALQNAVIIQYGRILTHGRASDVAWLAKDNPMNWLQQKLSNYAGEFYDPTPLTVEPGNWVFDLNSRELIYVPRLVNNFKPGKDGKQWIRYHVVVQYEPPRLPSLQNAPSELTGILFEPVEPYSWF